MLTVTFVYISLVNPHFELEPHYITRKPIVHRIQRYIPRREILSTFRARVTVHPVAIVTYRSKMPKNARNHARNSPSPLRHVDFHLTHECLGPPHSPCQMTARSLYTLPLNDTSTQRRNKVPVGYNGIPQIHPQTGHSPLTIITKI